MIKIIFPLFFSFLFCSINAQDKEKEQPFYSYYLWYNGAIGDQEIKAKLSLKNGNYTLSYAYNHNKKWIRLKNSKLEHTTISGKATIDMDKYTDGFVKLQVANLWELTGELTSITGEITPIELKVALKNLPASLNTTVAKNELTPLLLKTTQVTDSISVYYSERDSAAAELKQETYSKSYVNLDNQIIYVDSNYDGYLDITIGDAIYLYDAKNQRFEVENSHGDFYPGIQYINAYDPYAKTFESSHWRTTFWYKAINAQITTYEREDYSEYHNESSEELGVVVSENRIRISENEEENYRILALYLNDESKLSAAEIVTKFIGDKKIGILKNAQLILYYPSGKTDFYNYNAGIWKPEQTEIEK